MIFISTDPGGDIPDTLVFSLVLFVASKSKAGKIPILLKTITEDAMLYFLFIFSSHLVLTMTLLLGRVSATALLSGLRPMISNGSLGSYPASSSSVRCH